MGRPRQRRERANGPYFDARRGNWYVVLTSAAGARRLVRFATEAHAQAFLDAARAEASGRSVAAAIAAYLADCRERGLAAGTIDTYRARLTMLLCGGDGDGGALADLRPARARRLLEASATYRRGGEVRQRSVVDRRLALGAARTLVTWCVAQGWLPRGADPFAGLMVKGRARRGKTQLRVDSARLVSDELLRRARRGDLTSLAVLLTLWLGRRPSELYRRVARDLDDRGRLLWIEGAKTESGNLRVEVPAAAQPALRKAAAAAREIGPDAPIFPGVDRHRMLDRVHQVCAAVGVERVTTYSLRGLHGSLARERVSTSAIVAGALGHADRGATAERHYLDPSAVARSSNRAVAAELGGSARKPKRTR